MPSSFTRALACSAMLLATSASQAVDVGVYYATALRNAKGGALPAAVNDADEIAASAKGRGFEIFFDRRKLRALALPAGAHAQQPAAINASGAVAGSTLRFDDQGNEVATAFATGPKGVGATSLGGLGGTSSFAQGIDDAGEVTGFADTPDGLQQAFITDADGSNLRGLGTLGGALGSSYGAAINASGQVVGWSPAAGTPFLHAFITAPHGGAMTDLGALGGDSQAFGVNDVGIVVGFTQTADLSAIVPFVLVDSSQGMRAIGSLGGVFGEALAVNHDGNVVGTSNLADGTPHAFVTGDSGITLMDLNLLTVGLQVVLTSAVSINDAGHILAVDSTGQGYLLCPTPNCK